MHGDCHPSSRNGSEDATDRIRYKWRKFDRRSSALAYTLPPGGGRSTRDARVLHMCVGRARPPPKQDGRPGELNAAAAAKAAMRGWWRERDAIAGTHTHRTTGENRSLFRSFSHYLSLTLTSPPLFSPLVLPFLFSLYLARFQPFLLVLSSTPSASPAVCVLCVSRARIGIQRYLYVYMYV